MNSYQLVISSPDGAIFEGEALNLLVRGANGDLAVMAGHIPFITSVQPCDVKVTLADETEKTGHVDGGLLTVAADKVTLLSGNFCWND